MSFTAEDWCDKREEEIKRELEASPVNFTPPQKKSKEEPFPKTTEEGFPPAPQAAHTSGTTLRPRPP